MDLVKYVQDTFVQKKDFPKFRAGDTITVPLKNGEGNFQASPAELERLEGEGRVVFRYVDFNPNGSANDIAGVTNASGNVVGLMPHPEAFNHATNAPRWARGEYEMPGTVLFENAVRYLR